MIKHDRINQLEDVPVKRLLWQYALPAIIGSSVNALYNIITRFFIGNANYLGEDAMSAVGIALPIMIIIAAFGMLIGAGSASRISIFLGQNDKDRAERVLGNALILLFIIGSLLSVTLIYFLPEITVRLGTDENTYQFTYDFLLYFLPGSIFSMLCFSFNNMMRASGYPRKAMYTMLLTLVFNVLFAPLFIYAFEWGIKGAALSIVISMFLGTCFVLYHFMGSTRTLRFKKKNIRLEFEIVRAIISIGMSPFLMQLVASSVVFIVIQQVQTHAGGVGVAAYTIVNALLMLIVMVMVGLTQGMQPIVGYCFGAGKIERMTETLNYTIKVGIGIGIVGFIFGVLFPSIVVSPFNPSDELRSESIYALRIASIMFPVVGFQIVATNFFQSIGKVKESIFLSLSRQLIFLVPVVLILPKYWGFTGVLVAIPFSDLLAGILTAFLLLYQFRKFRAMGYKIGDR